MRRIAGPVLATLVLATLALVALAAGKAAQAEGRAIRLGTTPEAYPPFTWVDEDGQLRGFEIDLAQAVCAAARLDCTWVVEPWETIIPALRDGRFDAIAASMSITAERRRKVDFSEPYYNTPAWFVGRRDQAIALDRTGLKGRSVGVQVLTIHFNFVQAKFGDVLAIRTFDTQAEANRALVKGDVDLLLADSLSVYDSLLSTPEGAAFEQKGPPIVDPIMGDGVGFAVRPGDDALRERLNAAIQQIRRDGTYRVINDRYFTFDVYGAE
ncbi:transporter substrate-binding domain-containing protein [Zavarzinia sp. CC-PAN008]|uniref:transporter substrate-binding domain-containing protein n=1 Tax=Zavarzinia sp. CC-PAN008 TaxID=3243332 RepID=UPI003F7464B8